MQGNVHPQEQAAMKTHNKSLVEKTQASLTAFFGPRQTDKDSGDTKMTPIKSPVARPVIQLFLVRCRCPGHWKINTFFLSVMLSSSLSFPPPMLDRVTMKSIGRLHVCVDLLSFSPMLSFSPVRFARHTPFPSLKKASERRTAWVKTQVEPVAAISHPSPLALFVEPCPHHPRGGPTSSDHSV